MVVQKLLIVERDSEGGERIASNETFHCNVIKVCYLKRTFRNIMKLTSELLRPKTTDRMLKSDLLL
jgi:hypothetical protein